MTRLSRSILAAAILALLPGVPLRAEPVPVRTGEHDGFTRLVLDLPRALPWRLETDGDEAKLALDGIRADFDLDGAFRRLTTTRVAGLTQTAGASTLSIALGCACRVEAFRVGETMLAIDIHGDPDTTHGARADAPPNTTDSTAPALPLALGHEPRFRFPFEARHNSPSMVLPFGPAETWPAPVRKAAVSAPLAGQGAADPAPPEADEMTRTLRLAEAERRLAEQLGRAAAQGLVTPKTAHLPDPHTHVKTDGFNGTDHPAGTGPDSGPAPHDRPGLNLRAQTSADRDFVKLLGAMDQTGDGNVCLTEADLDIAAWASDATFGQQVGRLRASLLGEFDRPDPHAARALARLYIHFGFGAEALHVLKTAELTGDGTNTLKSMAEIMEYGHARGPAPFSTQFDCDSPASLWAVLAHPVLPEGARPNAAALLRSLSALPPQIRGFLGPIVSDRLVAARQDDLAARVLRLVERGNDAPDARFEMALANVSLADGDATTAAQALDHVVGSNTELSPQALIALIDTRLKTGQSIDIQTAGLAGAYAQEYRKDTLGAELKRVHILALAEAGAYDDAFHELDLFAPHTAPDTALRLRSHAMAALARDGGNVPFLKHALMIDAPEYTALAPKAGNAVAGRLIALGFPAQAAAFLGTAMDGTSDHDRRLLRARSALAQMKPQRAEVELLGLTGPDTDRLRAEARSMSGDHTAALRLFDTLDRPDDTLSEAWLASDWRALRASGDPFWQDAAAMIAPTAQVNAAQDTGVLARNRALIETSAASRDTISRLLARLAVDTVE